MYALLFTVAMMAPRSEETWVKYAPEQGGFTVMLPGKPKVEGQQQEKSETDLAQAVVNHGSCRYVAYYTKVSKEMMEFMRPSAMIYMTGKLFEETQHYRKVSETEAKQGKTVIYQSLYEGINRDTEQWVKMHICVIKNYIVYVQVCGFTKEEVDSADARKCLESFKVMEK